MIRQLAIFAFAAVCLAVPETKDATKEFDLVKAQKWVQNLLSHIYQHGELDPEIREIVHDWDIEANISDDDNEWQAAIRELWSRYKFGMLPQGRIYAVHYPDLMEEAILMFKTFYHAPSYGDLMGIIYWAHTHLNEYQFDYALYIALVHSRATKWIALPQPYQIGPEYFFNTDVMQQVYDYKMGLIYDRDTTEKDDIKIVDGNYTNWYIKNTLDHEHDLTYFTEDVGLNTWYCYFNVKFPFWMSSEEYPDLLSGDRGQIYYYIHKMILDRYNLERLSHDLDEMESIDWDQPITVGYSPYMTYRNGMHFPLRTERTRIPVWKNEDLQQLKEFESRISQVVDSGYMMTTDGKFESIRTKEGFNKVANLVQGNGDSLNKDYYGSVDFFGRRILGFSPKPQNPYQVLPSALENSSTSLRDPAFYRLLKKINSYFLRYKKRLGPYALKELAFDGVEIKSVNIVEGQLTTYFEQVDTLIDTLIYTDHQNVRRTTEIKVRQNRLNHKPFTYNLTIDSAKDIKASIRIFLGPKYNIYGKEIGDNYENFFQTDYFVTDLKKGSNTIRRKSTNAVWFAPDYTSGESFQGAVKSEEQLTADKRRFGIPGRLVLPRGKEEGMPVQFFFYVSEFVEDTNRQSDLFVKDFDNKSLGFPLDRPMPNFSLPNMYFLDTTIYHKQESQVNLAK